MTLENFLREGRMLFPRLDHPPHQVVYPCICRGSDEDACPRGVVVRCPPPPVLPLCIKSGFF